jgi:hypothetical protein
MSENFGYKLHLINQLNDKKTSCTTLKLNKKEYISSSNIKYYIVNYDKNILSNDLIGEYGIYRSVILNQNNKIICFSPPKSISYNIFTGKYPEKHANIVAQEFIEGTMINVFWDEKIGLSGGWEICTKKNIGANNVFYQNTKTFREMFLEAIKANNLNLDLLNKNYCFSFVLQHPDNRIVVRFEKPQLYLIACYCFFQRDNSSPIVMECDINYIKEIMQLNTGIKFPTTYTWNNYKELENTFGSENTNYEIVGVMIINKQTGERTKIRNPVYEKIRNLKGNQSKLKFQFLSLRKSGKISEYLKYYPENKYHFLDFKDEIHNFTYTLFTNYISCYIKKEKPLIQFTPQFRTHMYMLHKLYITSMRDKKTHISKQTVIDYIYHMDVPLLLNSLNYQLNRKRVTEN